MKHGSQIHKQTLASPSRGLTLESWTMRTRDCWKQSHMSSLMTTIDTYGKWAPFLTGYQTLVVYLAPWRHFSTWSSLTGILKASTCSLWENSLLAQKSVTKTKKRPIYQNHKWKSMWGRSIRIWLSGNCSFLWVSVAGTTVEEIVAKSNASMRSKRLTISSSERSRSRTSSSSYAFSESLSNSLSIWAAQSGTRRSCSMASRNTRTSRALMRIMLSLLDIG